MDIVGDRGSGDYRMRAAEAVLFGGWEVR